MLEKLLLKNSQLKELDSEIPTKFEIAEIENDTNKSDEYTIAIIKTKCKLKSAIEKLKFLVIQSSVSTTNPCDFQRFLDQF